MKNKDIALCSVVLLAVLSGSAIAAADPWNGFYLGINGGLATANNPTTEATALPGQFTPVFANASYTHAPAGGLFGVQAGVNWRAAPSWVLGAEADWQWLGQSESICTYACLPSSTPPALLSITDQQSLDWLATFRGRLGWVSPGDALWYVTGGAAWARVDHSMTVVGTTGFFPGGGSPYTSASASFSQVVPGWTLGAGVETPLFGRWTFKAEYLFVHLATRENDFTAPLDPFAQAAYPPSTTTVTTSSSSIRDSIFRLGLNYQLGDPFTPASTPVAPILTKAQPIATGQDTFTHSTFGPLFGAQAGYNWRAAPSWVVGVEGDWQWAHNTDSACISECLMPTLVGVPPAIIITGLLEGLTDDHRLEWFGTARGRVGWIAPNDTLLYVTGGAAWGRVTETLNLAANAPFFAAGASGIANFSHVLPGWTVGGGAEIPLWRDWSVKVEYLFIDLGKVSDSFTTLLDPIQLPATAQTTTTAFSVHENVARLGLNYHFN
jgi:outer membrane immunogenic protein